MSDLLRSALGYFNNPSAGPGGPSGGVGELGGGVFSGASDETSAVGDVISFQCDNKKQNVRIQKLIAEGGFSYVYRGVDATSGELVAVKKMLAPDPEALKAVEQEVEFLRQFQHDNIIKFYGSLMRPSGRLKEYFIAMEYCPTPLPSPPLRIQHTTQVFGQTCKAIKYLHDFGIVHRDIKIENVLIGPDGLVKLVDFGSATMEKIYPSPDWSMNKRTIIEEQIASKTTPMYRAPEMLDLWSNHPIDEHSDMWALGCLLFALNFGQHPFQDSNKLAITNANYSLPKNASDANPLVCIIRGLLKVSPLERISFGQIYELLQSIAECEGFSLNGKLPFKPAVSPVTAPGPSPPVGNGAPQAARPPPPHSQPQQHHHHSSSTHGSSSGSGGGGLLSSIKGVGFGLIKNIKEQSQQYMYGPGGPGAIPPEATQHQPPSRPPPPPGSHQRPPGRPAAPSPKQQSKSQHLEFENREYDMMQQSQNAPPHRPAPPKPPPPRISPVPPEPVQETVGNLLDISLEPPATQTFDSSSTQPATKNDLLDDLFGFSSSSTSSTVTQVPQSNPTPSFADDLLWGNTSESKNDKSEVNLLGGTTDPFASLLGKSSSFQQPSGFGMSGPPPMQPGIPSSASYQNLTFSAKNPNQQQTPMSGMDLLGGGASSGKGSSGIPKNSSTPNLLSDLLMGDIMGGPTAKINVGGGTGANNNGSNATTAATANSMNKSNPTINQFDNGRNGNGGGPQGKPNYNRHQIFDASPTNPTEKKQTLDDAFGDFLSSQGFASAKGGNQTKTINDMRRVDMLQNQNIDPVQLQVNDWREGKKKNIRALLSSLHTVTWEECNWQETNMSQMITPAQVKKTYRKACLAIHPDKQMGQDWEQLAKLLFVELNEAWAAFEESQT